MRHQALEHRFVRNVPRDLDPGVLYISIDYATAVHLCCWGCGDRVVTPFTPTDWRMTFDGETISLHPSVGNWNQKCQSHHVIQRNRVLAAGSWSIAKIEAERRRDKKTKAAYYGKGSKIHPATQQITMSAPSLITVHQDAVPYPKSLWSRFKAWGIAWIRYRSQSGRGQ